MQPYETDMLYYGTCSTVTGAEDVIHVLTSVSDWKCLVHAFPVTYAPSVIEQPNHPPIHINTPVEWGFVLHKFHKAA